jgi:hypothetical protein
MYIVSGTIPSAQASLRQNPGKVKFTRIMVVGQFHVNARFQARLKAEA